MSTPDREIPEVQRASNIDARASRKSSNFLNAVFFCPYFVLRVGGLVANIEIDEGHTDDVDRERHERRTIFVSAPPRMKR